MSFIRLEIVSKVTSVEGSSGVGHSADGQISGSISHFQKKGTTSDAPRATVSRNVELGHHENTTLLRVRHDLLDVPVGVALLHGEGTLPQLGHGGHLDGEGLVVDEVPVEDVQLDPRHGVDDALDGADGEVVASGIDHQRAVLEMMMR